MRRKLNRAWQLAALVALSVSSFACGDSGSGDGDAPDLTGDSAGDNNNNGDDNNGGNDSDGGTANGGDSDGGNAPQDKCVKAPKSSTEFLNSCAPAGVESRAFNNVERLPASYEPGKLPAL